MADKQLVIVVDTTIQMAPHWETILNNYLKKIIRYFCRNESTSQDASGGKAVLGLITYGAIEQDSEYLVQRSGWTTNMNKFLQYLSSLAFGGGGFNEAAVSEALSKALMMFPSISNGSNTQQFGGRHCILVGASNPIPFKSLVLLPDAEAIATSFAQSSVSLSVICPKEFPRLRAIYDAGNSIHHATLFSINEIMHPQYFVLLSENFVEARAALNKAETDLALPSNFSDEDIMMLQQIHNELLTSLQETQGANFPTTTMQQNEENNKYDNDDDITNFKKKLGEQTMSRQEYIPIVNVLPENANGNNHEGDALLVLHEKVCEPTINKLQMYADFNSQENAAVNDYKLELTSMGIVLSPHVHHSSMGSLGFNLHQNLQPISSTTSKVYETINTSQCLVDLQGYTSPMGHSPMEPDKDRLKRKYSNAFSQPSVHWGMDSNVLTDSSCTQTSFHKNSVQPQGISVEYEKVWEGDITSNEEGKPVFVNKLAAYRKKSTSNKSVIKWPESLHVNHLLSQRRINNNPYEGDVEYLILEAKNHFTKLDQLKEKDLCAYIKLPEKTLILNVSTTKLRFIGTLYDGVFPVYKHQIYDPHKNL